ncbi:hypothetical protein M9H77_13036 [Catharanthus roseus]|uniref:Uncharacterized protein n=1 Tax=Catharanthus roseus TaxID=4058 RepID=A0ACC0BJA4_CATRO|nr:hypothetical protein M9H77_13036 [Catharanthus roseus]
MPNGEVYHQPVVYEKLPKFCDLCKVIGHSQDRCKSLSIAPSTQPKLKVNDFAATALKQHSHAGMVSQPANPAKGVIQADKQQQNWKKEVGEGTKLVGNTAKHTATHISAAETRTVAKKPMQNCIDSAIQVVGMVSKCAKNMMQAAGTICSSHCWTETYAGKTSTAPTKKPVQKYFAAVIQAAGMGCQGAEILKQGAGTSGNNLGNGGEGMNKPGIAAAVTGNPFGDKAATSRWANQPSSEDLEKMMKEQVVARHASLVKFLENKLAMAKGKIKGAEKTLAKVQEKLKPADLHNDLVTLTDEERFSFQKIGLSMKTYLLTSNLPIPSATSFSLF